jgi:hypothetical protein
VAISVFTGFTRDSFSMKRHLLHVTLKLKKSEAAISKGNSMLGFSLAALRQRFQFLPEKLLHVIEKFSDRAQPFVGAVLEAVVVFSHSAAHGGNGGAGNNACANSFHKPNCLLAHIIHPPNTVNPANNLRYVHHSAPFTQKYFWKVLHQ